MKRIHVFNPAAGVKHSPTLLEKGAAAEEERYVTTGIGDCERFVYETCLERPDTHFIVYGGDGTIAEAVSGIVRAGVGDRALLSVIPAGTGNDFVRSFPEKNKIYTVDAISIGNDHYAANIVNFGFDSVVVTKTQTYKKIFPGSAAYLAGVVDAFFHKIGEKWRIELENEDGTTEVFEEIFSLGLVANCQYYGGGFHSAPLADSTDGLLDFVAIRRVTRSELVTLIGDYKKGTHFDLAAGQPRLKFKNYMLYRRCRSVRIQGIQNMCADGEITPTTDVTVRIVPKAFRYAT